MNSHDQHFAQVEEAFSRKATLYDDFGAGHANLERMRRKVRAHVLGFLRPGAKLLELNAGTGADALFFARQGFRVHATDLSPGMCAQIEAKIASGGLQGRLTAQQLSFLALERLPAGSYDYVFSNMGGVNCAGDLHSIAAGVRRVLAPGGCVTWVVMPPVCLWELAQALRGNLRAALRRLSRGGVLANVEGVSFQTYYYWPGQVSRAFGRDFQVAGLQGLSVFTPTADRKTFPRQHPRLYRLLGALDRRLADRAPFNRWGDFYILTLRYQPRRDAP